MILETERLYLREMTEDDFPALCLMLQDPEVMYAYAGPFNDEEAHQWLDKQLNNYLHDGFGLWAVILKETGEMIGQCGLTLQDCAGDEVLEVGYLLRKGNFPTTPLILGFVLGSIMELNFRRALSYSNGNYMEFITHPISGVFLAIALFSLIFNLYTHHKRVQSKKTA